MQGKNRKTPKVTRSRGWLFPTLLKLSNKFLWSVSLYYFDFLFFIQDFLEYWDAV